MCDALKNGLIAGAALDVYEEEPLPPDSEILSIPNTVLTPHMASHTEEAMMAMAMVVEERPLFENEDWAVVESGLEHKRTGYFIEREALAHRRADGLWLWPMHVAEKSWCRMTPHWKR